MLAFRLSSPGQAGDSSTGADCTSQTGKGHHLFEESRPVSSGQYAPGRLQGRITSTHFSTHWLQSNIASIDKLHGVTRSTAVWKVFLAAGERGEQHLLPHAQVRPPVPVASNVGDTALQLYL
nr:uncharacterized protein LOC129381588 [Dermacentor andersoni]